MKEAKIKDEEATPAMWFLLEVFSKKLIGPRHEIKEVPVKPKTKSYKRLTIVK